MDLQNALTTLDETAHETPEERAKRLEATATEHEVSESALYETERAIRAAVRREAEANPGRVDQTLAQVRAFAPMLGIHPEDAEDVATVDTAVNLVGQTALADPAKVAQGVRRLDAIFTETGLYDELGTPEPEGLDP